MGIHRVSPVRGWLLAGLWLIPWWIATAYAGQQQNPFTGKPDFCTTVKEADGSPADTSCGDVKVTNGTFTNNGDGTYTLSTKGVPGGADTNVQFNDGGNFGGQSDFNFLKATDTLRLGPAVAGESAAYTRLRLSSNAQCIMQFVSTDDGSNLSLRRFNTSLATPDAVNNADVLGSVRYLGYDGTQLDTAALEGAVVDGAVSTPIVPGMLRWSTSRADIADAPWRMTLRNDGKLGIGDNFSPNNSRLEVKGNSSGSLEPAVAPEDISRAWDRDYVVFDVIQGGTTWVKPSVFDYVWQYDGADYADDSTEAGSAGGTPYTIFGAEASSDDYFYVGNGTSAFPYVWCDIATAGAGVTLAAEYWNGSAWAALSGVSDGTSNLTASGRIDWTFPTDWYRTSVNGYSGFYVRLSSTGTHITTAPTGYETIPNQGIVFEVDAGPYNPTPSIIVKPVASSPFGRVGIGTTSPVTALDVAGTTTTVGLSVGPNASHLLDVARINVHANDTGIDPAPTPEDICYLRDGNRIPWDFAQGGSTYFSLTDFDYAYQYDGSAYMDDSIEAGMAGGAAFTVFTTEASSNDYFYVGRVTTAFAFAWFDIAVGGSGVTIGGEYWNGSTWAALPGFADENTNNLANSGYVAWDMPTDWSQTQVNGSTAFWVRFNTTGTHVTTAPTAYEVLPSTGVGFSVYAGTSGSDPSLYVLPVASTSFGRVGVGTKTPASALDVAGTITATGLNLGSNAASIAKLSNLTSNGFVKTSGGDGTLSVDTTSYTPTSRTLTMSGTTNQVNVSGGTQDLSGNRTWTFSTPQDMATSSTPQFARVGLGAAADANHLLALTLGTITTDKHLIDGTATWNAGGTTFTAIKHNVTDTASAAGSLLLDLQVGGSSKFAIRKDGTVTNGAWNGAALAPTYGGTGQSTTPTADRYLKGDGTYWGTSAGAASGTGGCTNQFVRTLNSDAAPSCASVSLKNDVTGTLQIAKGGTNSTSFTAGSAIFFDGTSLTENNSAYYWDNANARQGYNTTTPSYDVSFGGTAARQIGMERATSGAGNNLTASAGGAQSGGTNLNGGNLILQSGTATGNGTSELHFATVDKNQGSGTTDRTATIRFKMKEGSHLVSLGTAPTLSSCGSGAQITGTDFVGSITFGLGASSCVMTYAQSWTNTAYCQCTAANGNCTITAQSATAVTFTNSTSPATINYICPGRE